MFSQKPGVVISDKDGWHKIGETMADFSTEKDEIAVIGADKFNSLKLRVEKAPIRLETFDVYFEDGSSQSVSILKELKDPGETREVKIDGGERAIKKVVFVYHTVANMKDKKAHVELWGHKSNVDKDKKVSSK